MSFSLIPYFTFQSKSTSNMTASTHGHDQYETDLQTQVLLSETDPQFALFSAFSLQVVD